MMVLLRCTNYFLFIKRAENPIKKESKTRIFFIESFRFGICSLIDKNTVKVSVALFTIKNAKNWSDRL